MLNAITTIGTSAPQGVTALRSEGAAPAEPAVSALATLSVPRATLVAPEPGPVEADSDFGAVYGPNGLPEGAAAPAYTVPSAAATPDQRNANNRDPSARLAMESTQLNALLSSLMTSPGAGTEMSGPAAQADNGGQLARIARQSVIAQFYGQF